VPWEGDVIATAAAIRDALARRRSETDYESRLVAIACFAVDGASADDERRRIRRRLRDHNGVAVDVDWPCILAVFPELVDAVDFSARLRRRLDGRIRIGVNLGAFLVAADGSPGSDSIFARWLMAQSEPGGMCVSAIAGDRVTARIGAAEEVRDDEPAGRRILFASLQWAGLLAYFLGWCYLIYWKVSYFAVHGSYPCWPQWACR